MNLLKDYYKFFRRFGKPDGVLFFSLVFTVLITAGLQVAVPVFLRNFVDGVNRKIISDLYLYASLFLGASIVVQLLSIIVSGTSESLAWRATNRVRVQMAYAFMNGNFLRYSQFNKGEFLERVESDVLLLANFFSQLFVILLANGLLIVGILWMLWLQNVLIAIVLSGIVILGVCITFMVSSRAMPFWHEVREVRGRFFDHVSDAFNNRIDIFANRYAEHAVSRFLCLLSL